MRLSNIIPHTWELFAFPFSVFTLLLHYVTCDESREGNELNTTAVN